VNTAASHKNWFSAFHVDYIIARIHGGNDEANKLRWACTHSISAVDAHQKARLKMS
jgi:hypothetical protein